MSVSEIPLVSVVIPFFNVGQYLQQTIESVLNQEYTNWEIVLIDDASSDGSVKIANEYVSNYPGKIYCFAHPDHINRGAAASRNLGAAKARGELLAFLDSDDLWLPHKLKEQVAFLQQHPHISVHCEATKYWYSWSRPEKKDKIILVGAPADKVYHPPELARLLYPLGKGASFCTCALMIRATSFKAFGGLDESFTGSNQLYEDQVLFLKICLNEIVYLSSGCNNIYRQRPNSTMHGLRAAGHKATARYYFLSWLKNYVEQKKFKDKEIDRLMKKELLTYQYPTIFKALKAGKRIKKKLSKFIK